MTMFVNLLIATVVLTETVSISAKFVPFTCYSGSDKGFKLNDGNRRGYNHCQYHIFVRDHYTTVHGRGVEKHSHTGGNAKRKHLEHENIHNCGIELNSLNGVMIHCKCYKRNCNEPITYEALLSSGRKINWIHMKNEDIDDYYKSF